MQSKNIIRFDSLCQAVKTYFYQHLTHPDCHNWLSTLNSKSLKKAPCGTKICVNDDR